MTLTGRGALVYQDGLQVIHLHPCIQGCLHGRHVGTQVNAERETELVASLDLHQLLHHRYKGYKAHHAWCSKQGGSFYMQ